MEEGILQYWQQISALVVFVVYTVRNEMIIKQNKASIKSLETKLSSDKTNEWVEFKAVTEVKIKEHEREIHKLFAFHEKET